MNQHDIDRDFDAHPASEADIIKHDAVRDAFKDIVQKMVSNLPEGRERSIVRTKLEEASFYAHAAIARDGK